MSESTWTPEVAQRGGSMGSIALAVLGAISAPKPVEEPGRRARTSSDSRLWEAQVIAAMRPLKMSGAAAMLVARAMVRFFGQDSRCFPSYAGIAAAAGTCERTAQRAVKLLAKVGLLSWVRRYARVGSRLVRTSNAYTLVIGKAETLKRRAEEWLSNGHDGRGRKKKVYQELKTSTTMAQQVAMGWGGSSREAQEALRAIGERRLREIFSHDRNIATLNCATVGYTKRI